MVITVVILHLPRRGIKCGLRWATDRGALGSVDQRPVVCGGADGTRSAAARTGVVRESNGGGQPRRSAEKPRTSNIWFLQSFVWRWSAAAELAWIMLPSPRKLEVGLPLDGVG
jgi:hypothetical protein